MNDYQVLSSPHKNFEEIKRLDEFGIEYWEARELMPLLGYSKWSNFDSVVIKKAKTACKNSDQAVKNHFADTGKMIDLESGSKRQVRDSIRNIGGIMPEDLPVERHIKKLEQVKRKQLKERH